MPKKPDNDLLEIFTDFPPGTYRPAAIRWLGGGPISTKQTSLMISMVLRQATKDKILIKMDDGSGYGLNPDFYKAGKPQYSRSYKTRLTLKDKFNIELHERFESMQPSTYPEVLAFISGTKVVDGRVSKEAYTEASPIQRKAQNYKVIVKGDDDKWRYSRNHE
jgi:hypothetical protein